MDPYKVLEVKETASKGEIRAAYLRLVKKYHPDKYPDNDLKEMANEKLKQVNEAYDMLTRNGGAQRPSGGSRGTYGGNYSGPNAELLRRARAFIHAKNYSEAARILESVQEHNAEWNYLYGILHMHQGWHDRAREHLRMAYEMDPGNAEYRNAYMSMAGRGSPFAGRGYYNSAHGSRGVDPCTACSWLCCIDSCCECMGGDCIRCC